MNDQNFRELVLHAAQGNVDAFQELYRLTRQKAWFVALSIAKNEHDAQDILQESYIKAMKRLEQLEDPEKFVPWLNQIVANQAKNYIARKKPDSFAEYDGENAQDWQEETDPDFIPDEHLDQEEAKALIAALVKKLPEDQRLVVLLRYYDDMEIADIAKSLEIPEGTVKSRLGRARQKLAAMLQQSKDGGLKLYSLAPIPLLAYFIKLLGFDAPGSDRLPPLLVGSAAAGTAGGAAVAAAKKAPLAASKIAALAAAAVVTVGGLAAGVYAFNRNMAGEAPHGEITTQAPYIEEVPSGIHGVSEMDDPTAPAVTAADSSHFEALENALPSRTQQSRESVKKTDAPSQAATTTAQATNTTAAAQQTTTAVSTKVGSAAQQETTTTTARSSPTYIYTQPPDWTTRKTTTTSRRSTTAKTTTTATTTSAATTTTEPSPTNAAENFEFHVTGYSEITITRYTGSAASVVIPASIDGKAVCHLGAGAFAGMNVTRVVISSGIDCIGSSAFANCPNLTEVVVPNSVYYFGNDAFSGSSNVVIVCEEGSPAHQYAQRNGIAFRLQ